MDTPQVVKIDSLDGALVGKINLLSKDFKKQYNILPDFIARVPGRYKQRFFFEITTEL